MTHKRIVFMASSEIALPTLESLCGSAYRPCIVFTQPPRPKGRGLRVTPTPIHEFALSHGLEVKTPDSWTNMDECEFGSLGLDCVIVFAYGQILPENVLKATRYGFLNLHASLLPRWRGAAPIQRAIEAGDTISGISLMAMTKKLDAGPILDAWKYHIPKLTSAPQLFSALGKIAADNIVPALDKFFLKKLTPIPQDEKLASYAHKIKKSDSKINWNDHALKIQRKCLALTPDPCGYFSINNENIKVLECLDVSQDYPPHNLSSGTIISVKDAIIACGNNSTLKIISMKRPNKKNTSASQVLEYLALGSSSLS